VVVLKQKSLSEDRWTHDSLHEGSHIIDHGSDEAFSVIENEVPSPEEPAEERAARFAADVVLDGRADELAELAVDRANNEVSFLKRSVPQVAHDTAVSVGALANYLAFRISKETADTPRPINWWGTAAKLQRQTKDPWDIARNVFLEHADLSRLNPSDRDLLVRALVDLE